uniref:Sorting nexin-13-like n=1 Tax=Cynoglossus semilaevis TaxID=244447 RepID=A0A3P8WXX9_CYNSE
MVRPLRSQVPPLLPKAEIDPEHCRVSAQLDDNVDDNIPLRVMLLLMDEVFDLKEKNQWLHRNIKNLLQQLIRATYGDTINNHKMSDYSNRDSYWPNGILAETPPRRDKSVHMRTRVAAKTSLLGIMPSKITDFSCLAQIINRAHFMSHYISEFYQELYTPVFDMSLYAHKYTYIIWGRLEFYTFFKN